MRRCLAFPTLFTQQVLTQDLVLQVLTAACVLMWLVVAIGTVQRSISGKMFFAPCLGTNLYQDSADDNNNVGEDLKLGDP